MTRHLVRLEPEAKQDIREAWQWYEQRRTGLGEEFVDAVDDVFELIAAAPERFPLVHRNVRQVLIKRFPYSVCYVVESGVVYVVAVLHSRRAT